MRRKQVDSDRVRVEGQPQLARELKIPELVVIGVGSTVGAGVYVLVGTVAREHAGPALTISFLIAGIAAALSAFCYAELASRCPSAGSAYHYSYICVGEGYFPFGVNGMLAGSATVFFAYIGFDTVASTAEEVKNPQRDLPLGIALALAICCLLYMAVSIVIVGLVPYFAMDPDTPISSAFAQHGMQWAMYVVTSGAVLALCSTLMGSLLPQPRILMAMARDGLLPSFFSDVNKKTQVPVKSTIVTGIVAAALAFGMDVSQLAGMVSVGTLLAFIIVAISILILRYVPPDEVPLPPSMQESYHLNQECDEEMNTNPLRDENWNTSHVKDVIVVVESMKDPLIKKEPLNAEAHCPDKHISAYVLPISVGCIIGVVLLVAGLSVLSWIDQDDGRHSFGYAGGFMCPFVPLLPVMCILINTYLLINLGGDTWMRVGIWLLMGVLVYIFYGRTHSSLKDVVYVPVAQADEIYRTSSGYVS
ncbi:hypothetical protein PR202_gb11562 [Eleusine coracana subsp. coracana]|uniref:Cationic amino acid transporter C-terminal domain-containing protein n=1 Tax=Eleusine coracana subsp. coracana TaxID=191504 RepID=A0AAV5ENA2_ELECO|nr:hypothetical protein PR202_gb11562 [Eleusine coracana subsp. coracana]